MKTKKKTTKKNSGIDFSKLYALTETTSLDTRINGTYVWGFTSFAEGRDHLREIMRETVNQYTEGLSDDEIDIDGILDEILESPDEESECYGKWTWECSETEIVWELGKFCKIP